MAKGDRVGFAGSQVQAVAYAQRQATATGYAHAAYEDNEGIWWVERATFALEARVGKNAMVRMEPVPVSVVQVYRNREGRIAASIGVLRNGRYRVVDGAGRVLGTYSDLPAAQRTAAAFAEAAIDQWEAEERERTPERFDEMTGPMP